MENNDVTWRKLIKSYVISIDIMQNGVPNGLYPTTNVYGRAYLEANNEGKRFRRV
jgi:hypothetical protein